MCGIVGLLALREGTPPSAAEVRAMAGTLAHRGPDDDGFLVQVPAALGYRRLSVIDLQTGQQPIWNEDRSVAAFQNGEIYNYRDLRQELAAKGHALRTGSDTEVLVHLYEEYGEGFPEHLRGMFAVAVFDRAAGRLVLARDRLGKKPLYYAQVDGRLAYASELKALLALPAFPRQLDDQALFDYFTYRYVPTPKTIFRAARKLPPGHLLVADAEGVRPPRPYWQLSFANPSTDPLDVHAAAIREALEESVRLRLAADVPLGAFLSGGMDSAAVVSAMAKSRRGDVRTYTVGFGDPRHDERAAARATAVALGTSHTEATVSLDPSVALDVLPWHFDEPFADSSAVPTYAVAKSAREQVTVALSGDGGDEIFAGYDHHAYYYRMAGFRRVVPRRLRPVLRAVADHSPKRDWRGRPVRGRAMLGYLADEPLRAYFGVVCATDPAFLLRQVSGDFRAVLGGYDPCSVLADAYARTDAPDALGRILQLDLATFLSDDILTKVDRASMAVSLEVRCPLLDHRLVELAARIPTELKLRDGESKWIFREAIKDLVPASVLERPKHGFDVPLRDWTVHQLRPALETAIRDAPAEIFDRAALQSAWGAHLAGRTDRSEFFWALLVFDRWRQRHGIPAG